MRQNNVINIDLEKSGRVMCYLLIYVAHSTEYKGAVHKLLKVFRVYPYITNGTQSCRKV